MYDARIKSNVRVVVIGPASRSVVMGSITEVSRDGTTFQVAIMDDDPMNPRIVLSFLGPPDSRGWWEGGYQLFRMRFFCALAPEGMG